MNQFYDNIRNKNLTSNYNSFSKSKFRFSDPNYKSNLPADKSELTKLNIFSPPSINFHKIFTSNYIQEKSRQIVFESKHKNRCTGYDTLLNRNYFSNKNNINDYADNYFPRHFHSKPSTAINMKRPKEGLKKGQNQLILERLIQKCNSFSKDNIRKKSSTSNNFFLKTNRFKENKKNDHDVSIGKIKFDEQSLTQEENKIPNIPNIKTNFLSPKKSASDHKLLKSDNKKMNFVRLEFNIDKIRNNENKFLRNNTEKIKKLDENSINNKHSGLNISVIFEPDLKIKENICNNDIIIDNIPINLENSSNVQNTDDKKNLNTSKIVSSKDNNLNNEKLLQPNLEEIKTQENNKNEKFETDRPNNNINSNKENSFKLEENKISDIVKRVLEKNKKEAKSLNKDYFSSIHQNYMNLNYTMNKTQGRFFTASSNLNGRSESHARPSSDKKGTFNYLELVIKDSLLWKKHEEIWNNVLTPGYLLSVELEKYLIPPNDHDILISSYNKMNNNFSERIILDDNLSNSGEEIQKWKKAYKRAVLRWHPDKLNPFIDELKLRDENKKIILKKKASIIMNNVNKIFQNIIEILKKINSNK